MTQLKEHISDLNKGKILVIGDLILDEFIWGRVKRISPEAPVPVVEVCGESMHLGGAANVANNLKVLGASKVYLAGVIGQDESGGILKEKLQDGGIENQAVLEIPNRATSRKTRVIAQHQQIVRVDKETSVALSVEDQKKLLQKIEPLILKVDGILLSDYGKGVISSILMEDVVKKANELKIPVSVDPKIKNFQAYNHVTLITPNKLEAGQGVGRDLETKDELIQAGQEIMQQRQCKHLLITLGEEGMLLFSSEKDYCFIDTMAKEIFDVTGAGDTVISVMSLAMAVGLPIYECALLANYAAGIAVSRLGAVAVTSDELLHALP